MQFQEGILYFSSVAHSSETMQLAERLRIFNLFLLHGTSSIVCFQIVLLSVAGHSLANWACLSPPSNWLGMWPKWLPKHRSGVRSCVHGALLYMSSNMAPYTHFTSCLKQGWLTGGPSDAVRCNNQWLSPTQPGVRNAGPCSPIPSGGLDFAHLWPKRKEVARPSTALVLSSCLGVEGWRVFLFVHLRSLNFEKSLTLFFLHLSVFIFFIGVNGSSFPLK